MPTPYENPVCATDAGSEKLESYIERFDFYCAANKIVSDDSKKATFLSTVGASTGRGR